MNKLFIELITLKALPILLIDSTDLSDEPSPTTSTEPEITTLPYQNSALVLSTSQSYNGNPVPFVVNFNGKLYKHQFCLEDF